MLSKNKIKYIHSLELKKKRKEEQVFVAEGPKLVRELLGKFPCSLLLAVDSWLQLNSYICADEIIEVTDNELTKVSLQKCPQEVLAVFKQPVYQFKPEEVKRSLTLALDGIQDPGNLGTIIRLADWFGIEHIFCSLNTVDAYNPKTIQATMGSIARVKLYYCDLPQLILQLPDMPIYGTFLEGKNIYEEELSPNGLVIMGNEGNGVSKEIEELITHRLYVPSYPNERQTAESLNVAIATAIICSEFRRR